MLDLFCALNEADGRNSTYGGGVLKKQSPMNVNQTECCRTPPGTIPKPPGDEGGRHE